MNSDLFAREDVTYENCPEMRLREVSRLLIDSGIENGNNEARQLFLKFGGLSKSDVLFGDAVSSDPELYYAIKRRLKREPFSYIVGEVGFYRESYITTPAVLVPRQDTEHLVDYGVKNIPDGGRFLDICTGSGCVAISVLNNTKNTTARAIDISPEAIEVAKRNRENVLGDEDRLTLTVADALTFEPGEKFDAILSNPPYIPEDVYLGLEAEIFYEPRIAFVGGGRDGGDFYRALTSKYKNYLKDGGFIAYEIGYDQRNMILGIAEREGFLTEIIKDYSGNDRVVHLHSGAK
jgi:release factor glutamine methyltransferase